MECSIIEVCQYKVYEMGTFLTAIVSEIATGDAPVSSWPVFFLSLLTVPQVFAKLTRPSFFLPFLKWQKPSDNWMLNKEIQKIIRESVLEKKKKPGLLELLNRTSNNWVLV